jgi:hypothetical protein
MVGGGTLSVVYTGTTMHCIFILYNLDVTKINYAPTEQHKHISWECNPREIRAQQCSGSAATGSDAWRCTLPTAKNAIITNGRQKDARASRVYTSIYFRTVTICFPQHLCNTFGLFVASCALLA